MDNKGKISALKAWLIVLVSLIDDVLVLAVVFLVLRYFNVDISWPWLVVAGLVVFGFLIIVHRAVVPAFRRRRVTGAEGMLGMEGTVTGRLQPVGTVKIDCEYWKAGSVEGIIEEGEIVKVVSIRGLRLEVERKTDER